MQEEEKGGEGLKLYHMAWNGKVKENALCTCLNVPVWGKKKIHGDFSQWKKERNKNRLLGTSLVVQ